MLNLEKSYFVLVLLHMFGLRGNKYTFLSIESGACKKKAIPKILGTMN